MATKLYFRDIANDQSGSYPATEKSSSWNENYTCGGYGDGIKKMNTTIGSSMTSKACSTANTTTVQRTMSRVFTSPPIDGNQTIGGGNAVYNIAIRESNTNVNWVLLLIHVFVWRPSTNSLVGVVCEHSATITEPSANTDTAYHITGITTSAVNANDGDVIIAEIWFEQQQGMSTSYTATFYFDGTTENTSGGTTGVTITNHASFLELAETLSFQGGPTYNKKGQFLQFFNKPNP